MRLFQYISLVFLAIIIGMCFLYSADRIAWWGIAFWIVLYLVIVVLGVINIRWNFFIYSHSKAVSDNMIALTFDDGPAEQTEIILDILKEKDVHATFFCIGRNVDANPDIVKRMYKEGHVVANHTYRHSVHFDWKNTLAMAKEIEQTNTAIMNLIGWKPILFRPPFGVTNPNLSKAIRRTNMRSIGWSVRSYDTVAKKQDKLLKKVLNNLNGGDIILLHDTKPITKEILTELIDKARQKGFTFMRVDRLLEIDAYA